MLRKMIFLVCMTAVFCVSGCFEENAVWLGGDVSVERL